MAAARARIGSSLGAPGALPGRLGARPGSRLAALAAIVLASGGCAEGVTAGWGAIPEPDASTDLPPDDDPAPAFTSEPPAKVARLAEGSQDGSAIVLEDGSVWGWGWFGRRHDRPFGSYESRYPNTPYAVRVPELRNVVQVAFGLESGCALHADGTVSCWGDHPGDKPYWGGEDLGLGEMRVWRVPISEVVSLDNHGALACAIRQDGSVWCWGYGELGGLGQGTPASSLEPVRALVPTKAVELSLGGAASCARGEDGSVWCWPPTYLSQQGYDDRLADPLADCSPQQVLAGPADVRAVRAGWHDHCLLFGDGSVQCAGDHLTVRLGGDPYDPFALQPVVGLPPVRAISLNAQSLCVLLDEGAVQCVGDFSSMAFAMVLYPEDQYRPVASGAVAIDGASRHCALVEDGSVRCWGRTPLGDGSLDGWGPYTNSTIVLDPRTVVWSDEPGPPDPPE